MLGPTPELYKLPGLPNCTIDAAVEEEEEVECSGTWGKCWGGGGAAD